MSNRWRAVARRATALIALMAVSSGGIAACQAGSEIVHHVDGEGPLAFEPGVSTKMIAALDATDAGALFGMMLPCVMDGGGPIRIDNVEPAAWIGDSSTVKFGGSWMWHRPKDAMPFLGLTEFPPENADRIAPASLDDVNATEVTSRCPTAQEADSFREPTATGAVLDLLIGVVPVDDDAHAAIDGLRIHYRRGQQRYIVTIDIVVGVCGRNHSTPESCDITPHPPSSD